MAIVTGGFLEYRHRRVWSHLPPLADNPEWPEELRERVVAADQKAAGYWDPVTGLAELSRLYHANACTVEAMQCYRGLRLLEAKNAHWPHLLATLLAGYGRLDEALPLRESAVELDPEYLPARLRLGDVLLKSNRVKAAQAVYEDVLLRSPTDPFARLGLARCAMVDGQWIHAREHLDVALESNPEFAGALTLMVTVYENLGDLETADFWRVRAGMKEFSDITDPWLDALMDDCFDPYRVSVAAAVARFAGHSDRALVLLERSVALAPDDGSYHRQLARLHLEREEGEEAFLSFERALDLDPTDEEARAYLIQLWKQQGDEIAVDRAIADGLALNPNSATLHFFKGLQLSRRGNLEASLSEFGAARDLKPDNVKPYLELATIWFRLNQTDRGLAELRGALSAEPGNLLALSLMARHAIQSGDGAEAQVWLERIQKQPRFPEDDLAKLRTEYQAQFGHGP